MTTTLGGAAVAKLKRKNDEVRWKKRDLVGIFIGVLICVWGRRLVSVGVVDRWAVDLYLYGLVDKITEVRI